MKSQKTNRYPEVIDCKNKPDDDLKPGTLYIVGDTPDSPRLVGFLCPCGCRCELWLPMRGAIEGRDNPTWLLERLSSGVVSLHPSINITSGCHAHFWLKNNQIQWC